MDPTLLKMSQHELLRAPIRPPYVDLCYENQWFFNNSKTNTFLTLAPPLAPSCVILVLWAPLWVAMGSSWVRLGSSKGSLGPTWATKDSLLSSTCAPFGALLGHLGSPLALMAPHWPSSGHFVSRGCVLELPGRHFGASRAPFWSYVGSIPRSLTPKTLPRRPPPPPTTTTTTNNRNNNNNKQQTRNNEQPGLAGLPKGLQFIQ